MKRLIYFTLFILLYSCSEEAKVLTENNPHVGSESREDSLIWERDHAANDSLRVLANIEILRYLGCDNADTNVVFIEDIARISDVNGSAFAKGILLQEQAKNELCKLNNFIAIDKHFEAIEILKQNGNHQSVIDNYNDIIEILSKIRSLDSILIVNKEILAYSEKNNLEKGICDYKHNIAQLASFRSKNDTAIVYGKESLECAKAIDYYNGFANSSVIIADSYNRLGKPDSSLFYLRRALKICMENDFKNNLNTSALIRNNIGTTYYRLGELDSCIQYYDQSLKVAEQLDIKQGIATLSNNLGLLNKRKGDLKTALIYYRKSANLHERTRNKSGIGTAFTNIGVTYKDLGEYEIALEYFRKAYAIFQEMDSPSRIAILCNSIGSAHKDMRDIDSAMFYYRKSEKINSEIKNNGSLAITLGNIGSLLVEMDSMMQAEDYLNRSWEILKDTRNRENLAQVLMNLAKIESKKKNYSKAKDFLYEAYEINKKLNSVFLKKTNAERLYWINFETGNYKDAIVYLKEFIQYKDEFENKQNQKEMMQFELQREYDQKTFADSIHSHNEKQVMDAQLAEQDAQIKAEQTTRYALFAGLFLVLVIAGVAYRAFRMKKKDNIIIQKQKEAVEEQKLIVEEKNHEIMDSINYAKRLQDAILPDPQLFDQLFEEAFVLYEPKDIVAGDFYWLEEEHDKTYFAVADCTGHGVPGAMVSVVCANALHKTVVEEKISLPGKILDRTREIVVNTFEKRNQASDIQNTIRDGMDIALCSLSKDLKLNYAGAYNPLWIVRNGEIIETKATKQPIGQYDNPTAFVNNGIQLEKGDVIYLFSDGYADQFGGEKGKKFKSGNLKKLLLSIQNDSLKQQEENLNTTLTNWRGDIEQIDDICVMGIRV
jgi:serine phosphatase RsbU (regulator of sigma subunit)